MSIDERDNDDTEVMVDSMPFVANEELVARYGPAYCVTLDDNGIPVEVTALSLG